MTLGRFSPSGGRVRRDKVGTLCALEKFELGYLPISSHAFADNGLLVIVEFL